MNFLGSEIVLLSATFHLGAILGIGFYLFWLASRDYSDPFVDLNPFTDTQIALDLVIGLFEFPSLFLTTLFQWIPVSFCVQLNDPPFIPPVRPLRRSLNG